MKKHRYFVVVSSLFSTLRHLVSGQVIPSTTHRTCKCSLLPWFGLEIFGRSCNWRTDEADEPRGLFRRWITGNLNRGA
ncbi:unnamed protein product [Cochlearia groenlandica]